MSKSNIKKESQKDEEQYKSIKKLLKGKNLNPKKANDLKTLLDLTLNPEIKKFNFEYLLNFLLKYMNSENEYLFYEYFFKLCELSKLSFVKILLEKSIDINCQNELGENPLHIAVSKNDLGKVIGKKGNTAYCIRNLVFAASFRTKKHYSINIMSIEDAKK